MYNFLGISRILIEGQNIDCAIDILAKNFKITNLYKVAHNKIIFCIDYKKAYQVFAIFDKKCYNVCVLSSSGLLPMLDFMKKRWGLYVGLALFMFISISFSLFTLKVEVVAKGEYDTAEITRQLNDAGLIKPLIAANDCKEIEKFVYLNFDDISFVSCSRSGLNLNISVVPSLRADVSTNVDAIVATADGVVSKIIVASGVAVVKKGDIVKRGDPLIIASAEGRKQAAIGEVYINLILSSSQKLPLSVASYERTGNYVERKVIDYLFFSHTQSNAEVTYPYYQKEYSSYYLAENTILPIKVNVTRFYELNVVFTPINLSEQQQALVSKAVEDTLQGKCRYEVLSEHIETVTEQDSFIINVILNVLVKCS